MFEKEVGKRVKTDGFHEDAELKRLLDEAKTIVLKEFEAKKKGSKSLCNRAKGQLEEKMDGVMKKEMRRNAERRRVFEEKYMGELVERYSEVIVMK